ncbi:MAG TPA: DUF4388 domain-containing protein [Ktedonobacteraceae bacterium]|nr:DUF4388 domain-containing protein [Ktedonobacteraceae bacterium]
MPQIISGEPLAQMVRSITLQKRTGVLQVEQLGERSAERGEIYFENGSLMRARTEREAGKAALRRISEWKQITCAFQSASRSYPTTTLGAPSSQEPKAERPQAHVSLQMDRLARMPELKDTESSPGQASQPLLAQERRTRPLNSRQAEIALSTGARSSMASAPSTAANQPLVLHGTSLEAYTPAQPAMPPRSVQRWTTHQLSALETLPVLRRPEPAPRVDPLPADAVPPGRMAIFIACSTVPTAQAIQQMGRHARIAFILLDGRRTIQDIARLTHQAESSVEQIMINLMQHGYTQLVSASQ